MLIVKKIALVVISCLFSVSLLLAQERKEADTKMDRFLSKTGTILKFEDYHLEGLKLLYDVADVKVRKFHAAGEVKLFYQISKQGKYSTKTASIAYEDLMELQKALGQLETEAVSDVATTCDYLENKFVTTDGVQVGYYVSKGKIKWYMVLEKYGSGNSIFVKDAASLKTAFNLAREKMEQLK